MKRRFRRIPNRWQWLDKLLAVVATANVVLIVFDLSYVPTRDLYFHYAPAVLTETYDPLKGIEPFRDTTDYLDQVDALLALVAAQGTTVLADAAQVEPLLGDLRDRSNAIIDENPFQLANKIGALERIKRDIRRHMEISSAKGAFQAFWSLENLTPERWEAEISFFETTIRPYIELNYFRSFSVRGDFTDRFWRLDLWFSLIFGLEYATRTIAKARQLNVPLRQAWLLRSYDLLWLIPFAGLGLPWLGLVRLFPWMIRVEQSRLLDLKPLRHQISQGLVSGFATEITEAVIIRLIDQSQNAIATADLDALTQPRPYINFNNTNEIEALTDLLVQLSFYKVLPRVKPDLNALLLHSFTGSLTASPLWQNLRRLPGFNTQPRQLATLAVDSLTSVLYDAAEGALNDPVGAQLVDSLTRNLSQALLDALKEPATSERTKSLLVDLLEEIKINYVIQTDIEDIESMAEEMQYLYAQAERNQTSPPPSQVVATSVVKNNSPSNDHSD